MNYTVFTSHYFTDWILTATTLVSFVISLIYRAHKQLFLIQIYIAASLFIDILFMVTELLFPDKQLRVDINCVVFNIYSILEIYLIYLFISRTITRKGIRITMKILFGNYVSFCVLIWIYFPSALISNTPHLFALEGIVITTLCLLYFYELMHSLPKEEIWKKSDFWVISGILFYFSTSCPFFMLLKGLHYTPLINLLFTCINYCLYTILFLAFIKAYLCPIHIQK